MEIWQIWLAIMVTNTSELAWHHRPGASSPFFHLVLNAKSKTPACFRDVYYLFFKNVFLANYLIHRQSFFHI